MGRFFCPPYRSSMKNGCQSGSHFFARKKTSPRAGFLVAADV
ncbi:hypothetical protein CPter91_0887 [Collimonas pratensis]|uniref:Uncharacterized protein n=1 Tax=Collimonas pratensis TaxID=279113 RepID=A0A127PZU7_9BURK|nr:hypothetical protein CPter91_0887 [Collimonas pratensis]